MRKLIIYLSLILLALLVNACGVSSDDTKNSKQTPRATLVTVTKVKNQTIEITQSTVGSLEGLINPTLAAETAGRVLSVNVSIGDSVEKGQVLIEF